MPVSPSRRLFLGSAAAAGACALLPSLARASDVPLIRYASAGLVGPGEIETVIFSPWFKQNVLKRHGKEYVLEATTARGTPGVATLLAAGQADIGTLAFTTLATLITSEAVPGGVSAIAEIHQDAVEGYASNPIAVLDESDIRSIKDLKGKTIAVNAFNAAVDITLRLALKQNGLDPIKDVRLVELPFPNIGTALRQKRIDAGVLAMPFQVSEHDKGGIRFLFNTVGVVPPYPILFQGARRQFLKEQPAAVKAWLADYVDALAWIYQPENRAKAIEVTADLAKIPAASLETYFLNQRDFYRSPTACITAASLQAPIDAMADLGLLPGRIELNAHVDASFLPTACQA